MKNLITFSLILVFSFIVQAQTNVNFKIEHKLGNNSFAFNQAASNNLGNAFNVSRLQYYISEITVMHDGGMDTTIEDLWILVNANNATNVSLGSLPITTLEGVQFAVGVNSTHNHLDPSTYPMSHPLAPKSPSMHWGWSAGYRFVAFEGKTGAGLNQNTEIHALGDGNYHTFSIQTAGVMAGSDLNIELEADYEGMLHDIDVSQGLIEHSESNGAADLLQNFAYYVFTSGEGNNSINVVESNLDIAISLFPNPSSGEITIENPFDSEINIEVYNTLGSLVQNLSINANGKSKINLSGNGVYFVNSITKGKLISSNKVVIAQ